MNESDPDGDPTRGTRGPPPDSGSVGRVTGAPSSANAAKPASLGRLFVGILLAYAVCWIALTLFGRFIDLPGAFVAIPILVVAVVFGLVVLVGLERARAASPPPTRRAVDSAETEEPPPAPWRPPPPPAPALDARTARRPFFVFAAVTLCVWFVPLGLAAVTGRGEWLLLVPSVVALGLYGLASAMLLRLVARGAWNATWYGHPPPVPRWVSRGAFLLAFALGMAVFFVVPGLFVGPLGFLAFLALPLAVIALASRSRSSSPADGHPPGVPR